MHDKKNRVIYAMVLCRNCF